MRISDWSSDVCSSYLAVGLQRAGLLVQQVGKGHRHLDAVAVMGIGNGVDDGHLAGQGELGAALCMGAQQLCFRRMGAALHLERADDLGRSEEHTSELQSLMRISYAVFCLKKKN